MVIVTRTLTPEEFGIWNLILGFMFYIIIAEPVISYWVTRETARGIKSGRTAVLGSGIFSIGGIFFYFIIAYLVGSEIEVDLNVLFFGAIIVPCAVIKNTLIGINLGWKPHIPSIAFFAFSITEIPLGLFLIYYLDMGLSGIIITVTIAHLASITILAIYAKDKISGKIKREFFQKWTKLFWLPIYPGISHMVSNIPIIVFPIITGSISGIGFWFAAVYGSILTSNSVQIAKAAYPKLVQGGSRDYIQENLSLLLYFAIFFVALSITFAKSSLFILNPIYESAIIVLIILAFYTFFSVLSQAFQGYLMGIERVDFDISSTFRDYIKSKLFHVPTIVLLQQVIFVVSLVVGLVLLSTHSQTELLIYWAIVILAAQFPTTIYFYVLVKKNFKIRFEVGRILKYLFSSVVVFGITFTLMDQYLVYEQNLLQFVPNLIPFIVLGGGGYLALTYLIDNKTKQLFKAVLIEINKKR